MCSLALATDWLYGCKADRRWQMLLGASLLAFIEGVSLLAEDHLIIWRWNATMANGWSALWAGFTRSEETDSFVYLIL